MADLKKIADDKLKARLNELIDVNNDQNGCGTCGLLRLLHKGTIYSRSSQAEALEKCMIREDFRRKESWDNSCEMYKFSECNMFSNSTMEM